MVSGKLKLKMSRDHGLAVTFAVCSSCLAAGRASNGKRFTARFFV